MKMTARNIMVFFAMFAALFSASPGGHAGDAVYRVVSSTVQNGKETVKRAILRSVPSSCTAGFFWDDAGRCIFVPAFLETVSGAQGEGDPAHITITGAGIFPVQANIETTETKPAKIADHDAIRLSFKISGGALGSDAEWSSDNSYEREIRSIRIDGFGMAVIDARTKVPLAGKIMLSRKIEAPLWSPDQTGEKLSGTLNMAWSIVP